MRTWNVKINCEIDYGMRKEGLWTIELSSWVTGNVKSLFLHRISPVAPSHVVKLLNHCHWTQPPLISFISSLPTLVYSPADRPSQKNIIFSINIIASHWATKWSYAQMRLAIEGWFFKQGARCCTSAPEEEPAIDESWRGTSYWWVSKRNQLSMSLEDNQRWVGLHGSGDGLAISHSKLF